MLALESETKNVSTEGFNLLLLVLIVGNLSGIKDRGAANSIV